MKTEIVLEIKPKYVGYVRLFANSAVWIIVMMQMLLFGPPMIMMIITGSPGREILGCIIMSLLAILALATIIVLFIDKKNFEATTYRVYADRIEFEEGFINHKYTTIRMEDIKEIHLLEDFVQRKAGLGSINFITAANSSISSTGVCFKDIQNPKAIYAKIKYIHENKKDCI